MKLAVQERIYNMRKHNSEINGNVTHFFLNTRQKSCTKSTKPYQIKISVHRPENVRFPDISRWNKKRTFTNNGSLTYHHIYIICLIRQYPLQTIPFDSLISAGDTVSI